MPSPSDPPDLWLLPRSGLFGSSAVVLNSVVSTMDEVWQRSGTAAEGLVVLAEEQTGGRGRFQRAWLAPARSSVMCSILLRPPVEALPQLSILLGLAAAEAIEATIQRTVSLKWPNDVQIGGRKAAGILVESRITDGQATVVGGIGINVNFDPGGIPGIPPTATSLMVEAGPPISRSALLDGLLARLDERYGQLLAGESLVEPWRARLETIGRVVRVSAGDRELEGTAIDVDRDGRLLVRLPNGRIEALAAGEVTLQV